MTPEQGDLMHEVLEDFWDGWKELVNKTYHSCNEDDEFMNLLATRMQEKATVYGAIER